jgi:hypothetical protein
MQHSPAEMVCSLHGIQAGAGEQVASPDHDVFDRSLRALTPAAKNYKFKRSAPAWVRFARYTAINPPFGCTSGTS